MLKLVSVALLLVASVSAGCARHGACVGCGYADTPVAPLPTEMRSDRGELIADVSAVASYEAVDRMLSPPPEPIEYRVLRADEVRCLAAAHAPLANLYDAESEAVLASPGRRSRQAASTLSQQMAFRAVDERNKAAGTALELFYSLAEAEANRDVLDRSIEEVDRAVANLDELEQSGLEIPMDRTALQRQKLDWLDQQIQLHTAIRRMQGQLQQICGFELDEATPPWPEADLTVSVTPTDIPSAIAEGLANRADLGSLRMLDGSLDSDTLPAVRSGMQTMSPGLGASLAARRLFGGAANAEAELPTRQSQLTQAQSDTEQTVRREISESAQNVETRLREIAVAKQRWEVWTQRVAGLREKREANGVTAFDVSVAQLELLRAEADVIHRVIAWKIAEAKLEQAQGILGCFD